MCTKTCERLFILYSDWEICTGIRGMAIQGWRVEGCSTSGGTKGEKPKEIFPEQCCWFGTRGSSLRTGQLCKFSQRVIAVQLVPMHAGCCWVRMEHSCQCNPDCRANRLCDVYSKPWFAWHTNKLLPCGDLCKPECQGCIWSSESSAEGNLHVSECKCTLTLDPVSVA